MRRAGVFLLLWLTISVTAVAQVAPIDINRIQRATVLIYQTRTTITGVAEITCVGSGTLVSGSGLILTNAHATTPSAECPGDALLVALSVRENEPPVLSYRAELVEQQPGLDLALLQITAEISGKRLLRSEISLPFVELGDSGALRLDETIIVAGYPGLGDDPVLTTAATVQGFAAEPRGGERSWIKFRTGGDQSTVPGTMSGGGAYNRDGLLIGVPTTAPLGRSGTQGQCVQIQDSNRDGLINASDTCVPLGGTINALRPSLFVEPLFRSAALELNIRRSDEVASTFSAPVAPGVSNLFFAPSVSNNQPSTVIDRLPAGNSSVYLFFDYVGMTPETVIEMRVSINGVTNPVFSLPPVRWSGGERGLWHFGLTGQMLPNGTWSFSILIDGQSGANAPLLEVGGTPSESAGFRSINFVLSQDGQMFGNGYVLGVGTTVTAQYIYANMAEGMEWTGIWYFNGVELSPRIGGIWSLGSSGSTSTAFEVPSGLLPGTYRLALYLGGRLSALADFTIAGARADAIPRVFSNLRYTVPQSGMDAATARAVTSVTVEISRLSAVFDWEALAPGTLWQMRWSVDGRVFSDTLRPWALSETGSGFVAELSAPQRIPDGTYRLELLMNGILMNSVSIEVGVGQLPVNIFEQAEGVLMRGRLIDAQTGAGVPDVTIFVLDEQFSVEDFEALATQIYTTTVTDRDGRYQFSRPLFFGVPYSLIIEADGYLPVSADGVEVNETTPNPLDIDIYLTRG